MRKKREVLFVTSTLEVGGSESKIVNIVNAFAERDYPIGLAYLNAPETLLQKVSAKVPVTHLERKGKYSIQSLKSLRRLISRDSGFVVSVNFYPLLYVLPAARMANAGDLKTVCLVNTTDFVDRQWIWGRFYAPFIRRCDRIVYGSDAQQKLWSSKYSLPLDRSSLIYNGVNVDRFFPGATADEGREFRVRLGIPDAAVLIGGVGRLAPEKNFELLVQAVSDVRATGRDAYLLIVGEGDQQHIIEARAGECGIAARTVLHGFLQDIRPALCAMDIFVLPSRAVETFSNAALEAMAMELPVVLSQIGGAAEMVEDEESGYLFESGNRRQLVDILCRLLDSHSLRQKIGQLARQRVIENFEFGLMLRRYADLFDL